jgi:hypothetical protein
MKSVKVIRALLLAHAPVLTLVDAKNIVFGDVPQGTILPAIGIKEISRVELGTVSLSQAAVLVRARVQVTALAKSYRPPSWRPAPTPVRSPTSRYAA